MGQTWAGMFESLEVSSTPDADDAADTPVTVSYLEVNIPATMVIQ